MTGAQGETGVGPAILECVPRVMAIGGSTKMSTLGRPIFNVKWDDVPGKSQVHGPAYWNLGFQRKAPWVCVVDCGCIESGHGKQMLLQEAVHLSPVSCVLVR